MPRPPRKAAFIFIFITMTLDMIALGIMIPVLPKLVVQFEGGDVAAAARITGWFGFVWALMQFVFMPIIGGLSDRVGRRPIVLLSNLGLGLDYVLMALAPSLPWLFVGRVISGITAASFSTASAYITDVTPADQRAARFGMLGAAFGLGFVVGPALGGVLGAIDLRLPFWVAAGLSLVNAAYGFFVLPESLPQGLRRPFAWKSANPLGALRFLRGHVGLAGLAAATIAYNLAHESLPSVFVLYTDFRYHWSERTVGLMLAGVGIGSGIVSVLLVGPAVKKLGERWAVIVGLLFGTLGFLVYGGATYGWMFALGVPFTCLWDIAAPSMQSLMSQKVPAAEQGQLQGAIGAIRGLTGMVGPVLFTQLLAAGIDPRVSSQLPGAPFLVAAALLVLSLVLAVRAIRAQ